MLYLIEKSSNPDPKLHRIKGRMSMEKTEAYHAIYQKKQFRMIIFGLTIAFISAALNITFQNFNVAATSAISGTLEDTVLSTFFMSIMTLGISEFIGGVITIIWNTIRGIPLAEIGRNWNVRSGRMLIVSAIAAGPIGTGCSVVAISMCGSTYANCIIAMAPIVTAIISIFLLKEKISKRAWVGVVVSIVGAIVACCGAPEDAPNFMLGIAIACICPIAFALEGTISAHGVDVTDPMLSCPMYRMIISGLIQIAVALVLAAATGHTAWISDLFKAIFANPWCISMILATGICMFLQYNMAYCSFNYCGAAKSEAILWTGAVWSIPVGFIMQAAGILPYSVTTFGIIGAVIVGVGIIIVVAKPSELFSIRSEE